MSRRVAVFGLGYVGCVSAACLASRGNTVIGVDVSPEKVAMVNEGRTPVVEERIGDLIAEQVAEGRLWATTDAAEAVAATDLALVCVGTPSAPERRPADHLPRAGGRGDRGGAGRPGGPLHRRHPLHDAAHDVRGDRPAAPRGGLRHARRRGLRSGGQPRVPARGQLGTRLLRPAQDGHRPDRRRERRRRRRALRGPAGPGLPRAAPRRRDDQVRRQQLPRAEGRLRERDRRDLQGARPRQPRGDGHLHLGHEAQHLAGVPCARASRSAARACPRTCAPSPTAPGEPTCRCRSSRASCPPTRARSTASSARSRPRGKRRVGLLGLVVQAGHRRPAREPDGRARRAPARARVRAADLRSAGRGVAAAGRQPRLRGHSASPTCRGSWPSSADAVVNHAEVCVVGAAEPRGASPRSSASRARAHRGRPGALPRLGGVRGRARTTSVSAGSRDRDRGSWSSSRTSRSRSTGACGRSAAR